MYGFLQLRELLFVHFTLGCIVNAQLSPNSVARCPPGSVKSMHRQFATCVIEGEEKFEDASITAYTYQCRDSRTQHTEFRNVLRVITNGNSFRGRFNMHIFANDDERLQNYYSCIAFDRSEGLFLANFTSALPRDFYLLATFSNAAGYCHPDVI